MTREEAINALKEIKDRAWGWHINEQVLGIDYDEFIEIMDAVLLFLDHISRAELEQVKRERDAAVNCIKEIEDALNFQRISAISLRISEWRGQKED